MIIHVFSLRVCSRAIKTWEENYNRVRTQYGIPGKVWNLSAFKVMNSMKFSVAVWKKYGFWGVLWIFFWTVLMFCRPVYFSGNLITSLAVFCWNWILKSKVFPQTTGYILYFFSFSNPVLCTLSNFQKIQHGCRYGDNYCNFKLKYTKVCVGRNLWGRSFSFSKWSLPIIMKQKPIFHIFQKSNMAAIRGDNYW